MSTPPDWHAEGFIAAQKGQGIMTNPHSPGTPQFNHWIDGWCRYWGTR